MKNLITYKPFHKLTLLLICLVLYSCNLNTELNLSKTRFDNLVPFANSSNNIGQLSYKDFSKDEFLNQLIDNALKNNFDLQIAVQK